jgi:dolichol kinase
LILSAIATVAEGTSPKELDNFIIPLAIIGGAQLV